MTLKNKSKTRQPVPKKQCAGKCQKHRPITDYYKDASGDYPDGLHNVCKICINEQIDIENLDTVKEQLQKLNRPFFQHLWDKTYDQATSLNRAPFGTYMKNVQMSKLTHLRWKDGEGFNGKPIKNSINKTIKNNQDQRLYIDNDTDQISDELIIKWGEGHSPAEYRSFERRYLMLKNSYPEKTAMHTEAILNYIRYRIKEEMATAENRASDAKIWAAMAKDAATAAKINPSQLSQADLTGGLDSFGQLARQVEQAVDIVEILPRFIERPNDKVDFTILCYVNYERHLHGLPLVEHKDIYNFYEERRKQYEDQEDENFEKIEDGLPEDQDDDDDDDYEEDE